MTVGELKSFLADKDDAQQIKIDMVPNFRVDVVPLYPETTDGVLEMNKPDEGAAPVAA
jgi:hypothetical protein